MNKQETKEHVLGCGTSISDVIEMLEELRNEVGDVPIFIKTSKDRFEMIDLAASFSSEYKNIDFDRLEELEFCVFDRYEGCHFDTYKTDKDIKFAYFEAI